MDINGDLIKENIIQILDLKKEDDNIIFSNGGQNPLKFNIKEFDFEDEIKSLKTFEFHDTIINNPNYFEQLIFAPGEETNFHRFNKIVEDAENGLSYEISYPSTEYVTACFHEFLEEQIPSLFVAIAEETENNVMDINQILPRVFYMTHRSIYRKRRYPSSKSIKESYKEEFDGKIPSFKEVLNKSCIVKTIKIKSDHKRPINAFKKLSNSFLFSVGYNLSTPLMEFRYQKNHNTPFKRDKYEDILPPRRIYNENLLYYYQQALSTKNPVLQYLSFYQIIEYFYYQASTEKLIHEVKSIITNPEFSYKKTKSIEKVILKVKTDKFGERKAIDLVLEKYVNPEDLRDSLIKYDVNYYNLLKKQKVKFADANTISERSTKNNEKVIELSALGKRIYAIRNSLIHSKEEDFLFQDSKKGVYVPFTDHEEELRNEIPLIRLVAEQIVINSSEVLTDANLNHELRNKL